MLQKAYEARERYLSRREPTYNDGQPDDELSIFGGQTRLVNPKESTIAQPPRHAAADHRPSKVAPEGIVLSPVYPDPRVDTPQQYDYNHTTFADLSGGWDGLFHEVPRPAYETRSNSGPRQSVNPIASGEGAMLDDKWSSFMHNYGILSDLTTEHQY